MPIKNRDDAVEVEERISRVFAVSPAQRVAEVRSLFVETLDFNGASGQVSLAGPSANAVLPEAAERVAVLDGVSVVYVPLNIEGTDRVRKAEVDAAARLIADQLGDDMLMVFTNTSASQLHLILPKFEGARPTLRRMVVERDLPRRTAVQQVASIYWNHRDRGLIRAALDEAFDVEPVTKEFFAEYKRIFESAMVAVAGFGEGEEESKRTFVQTLFDRLMFVYFLSCKGWLRFDDKADYLNSLWQDYGKGLGDGNFHRDRLRPLFFSGLNNPNSRDLTEGLRTVIGDVPFLNGGLFEETELDKRNGIAVPDEAILQVLTGLFDRFNFTVMESTPFDIEVAVDPEMLGKVFEELVTGRHDSGAYYTPRPVVSFMCRRGPQGLPGWAGHRPRVRRPSPGSWTTRTRTASAWPKPGESRMRFGRSHRGGPGLRLRSLPAGHDAGAHRAPSPPVQRHPGRQETLRPEAGDHPAQPLRRGHRRLRCQHRHAAAVAFAGHRLRGRDARAAAQPGLQGSLRRQPAGPRPQQWHRGARWPRLQPGQSPTAGPTQGGVSEGLRCGADKDRLRTEIASVNSRNPRLP